MAFTTGQANAVMQNTGGVPAAYATDAQELARAQRLAQMLSSQQPAEGQMVSGRYVAPSWTQHLAQLVNAGMGAYYADKAETQQQALANKIREGEAASYADFMKTKQGTPATQQQTELAGPYGQAGESGANVPMPMATRDIAAVPANQQAAYANMYFDPRSTAQQKQFAFQKMNEGPIKLGAEETLLDPTNNYKPIASGGEKISPEIRTAAQMLGIRGNPETWTPQQTAAVNAQVMGLKRAGATNVSVNASNKFAGGFAEKASGGAYDMYTAALAAPQAIENSKRTIELVNKGAFTGPTANVALEAAKLFNVGGANNQEKIANTELLTANRGKTLLNSVKQSGLAGSAGLTEGERKFLTDAEGGRITLNGETLKAMAGLEIKLATQSQKKWNAQASKMDPEILRATGAGPVEVYTGIGTVDQKTVDKF